MQFVWIVVVLVFWMSQNSNFFAQMDGSIVGGVESCFWTSMYTLLSNMMEEA
jgi:hypothetical protein